MATHSIKTFSRAHPAFTESSIRNILVKRGAELEKSGAIFHLGRKVCINEDRFLAALAGGDQQQRKASAP